MVLVFLGIVFCIGCGDSSPQSWESGKPRPSAEKKHEETDVADNEEPAAADEPENPHKMMNPHGAMNPHGGMPMAVGAGGATLENTGKLDVETIHFTVPKSWVRKTPKMPNFIKAEYRIPKAEGDKDDGRLTVSVALGSVEDNVTRWKGQFGKKPDKENEETINADGVKIMLVDFTGTFDDLLGSGPIPDYRMLGAIFQVPGEEGLHFVKCYGPKKTITARADEIKGFLRSLKVDK